LDDSKADAVDIDNFKEFKQFVANVIANSAKKVTVFVDMAVLQNSWKAVSYDTISPNLRTNPSSSAVQEVLMMKMALRTRMPRQATTPMASVTSSMESHVLVGSWRRNTRMSMTAGTPTLAVMVRCCR
jgi:hypothetical protein